MVFIFMSTHRPRYRSGAFFVRGWLLLLTFLMSAVVSAKPLAVLYPDVSGPYIRVFEDIVQGVRKGHRGDVELLTLRDETEHAEVEQWLRGTGATNVVALGNRAMNIALQLVDDGYNVAVGAVLSVPHDRNGAFGAITMAPDPDLLFEQLKKLSPDIQSVSVVYQLGRHESLVDRGNEVAGSHGLTLSAFGTDNARDGANLYRSIIDQHLPGRTAIWLLQDISALKERSVLQSLLREAWDQKILVFSSNPSYVKKGALFSLFPNNVALGAQLAQVSLDQELGRRPGIKPSRELDSVLNTRTAEHLGLGLSRSRKRRFDILFPRE